jgi:hypothetical protein
LTRVEKRVSERVIKAATDTRTAALDAVEEVEKRLGAQIDRFDVAAINAKLDAFETNFKETYDKIPDLVAEAVPDIDLEAIGQSVQSHVLMAMKNQEAQLVRGFQAQLESMGIPQAVAEGQQQILAQIPQSAAALQRLAKWKVSPRFKEEHELEAFGLQLAQAGILQLLDSQKEGLLAQLGIGAVSGGNGGGSSSSGFRPGV